MSLDYPLRTAKTIVMVDVCKCGHARLGHVISTLKECRKCTCPHYEFALKMEWRECCLQQVKTTKQKIKDGYVI